MEFSAPIPSGPQVARPKPAVLRITPLGFFLHARDFLEASVLLSEKRGRTTFVAAFLSCRAIEMGLKAYLLARGDSVKTVKLLDHDLTRALTESYARGIDVLVELTEADRDVLRAVNAQYRAHTLAYWELFSSVAAPKNPDLHLLSVIAKKLLDGIEKFCYASTDGAPTPLPEPTDREMAG